MDGWNSLWVREGKVAGPVEPYENFEPHMYGFINSWVEERLDAQEQHRERTLQLIATVLRWPTLRPGETLKRAQAESDAYLAFLDALLHWTGDPGEDYEGSTLILGRRLEACGSVWTPGPDGTLLVRRVDPAAQDQINDAVLSDDLAAGELTRAWSAAFGRDPDPSDAWDHAIKAVEHVYVPLVVPSLARNDHATLGDVIGQLGQNPAAWITTITVDRDDPSEGVAVVRNMLRALWGNPDRHGGGPSWRPPEQAEAEALVHLAVTLVQWGRQGVLTKKAKS